MGGHAPFIIFYVIFSALILYFTAAMDYSVFAAGGAPNLSPITFDTTNILGILYYAYDTILKFLYLCTVSVRPEFAMLGIIYGALNIAFVYIIIDTILP